MEYNLQRRDTGDLEEIVGEIVLNDKIQKVAPPHSKYSFSSKHLDNATLLSASFYGGLIGVNSYIYYGVSIEFVSMLSLGILLVTTFSVGNYRAGRMSKKMAGITALVLAAGAATAYYLNILRL